MPHQLVGTPGNVLRDVTCSAFIAYYTMASPAMPVSVETCERAKTYSPARAWEQGSFANPYYRLAGVQETADHGMILTRFVHELTANQQHLKPALDELITEKLWELV